MTTDFIEIDAIIPEYRDMVGEDTLDSDIYSGLPEDVIRKWASAAAERVTTFSQKVHKICVLTVKDYKTRLPEGFRYVAQAAYRENPPQKCTREQVCQWTIDTLHKSGCQLQIDMVCPSCESIDCSCAIPSVEVDVNRIYQEAHPEYYYGYMSHFYAYGNTFQRDASCVYTDEFRLMRRTSNEFFNIPYHIGDCVNFKVNSTIEYDIEFPYMITSFKEGEVLLSYIGEKTDKHGYRMIPNTELAIQAVLTSIDERAAYRHWRKTKDPSAGRDWERLRQLREMEIGRAVAELKIPDKDKWKNFLASHWKQSIPFWHYDKNRNLFNPREQDNGFYWADVRKDYLFGY